MKEKFYEGKNFIHAFQSLIKVMRFEEDEITSDDIPAAA